jgi:hypothetical protein
MAKDGVKHDKEKLRWDLVPWSALSQVVEIMNHGAQKYGDDNWKSLPDAKRRYFAAAIRHLAALGDGEVADTDSGLHHAAHAACGLIFYLWHDAQKKED